VVDMPRGEVNAGYYCDKYHKRADHQAAIITGVAEGHTSRQDPCAVNGTNHCWRPLPGQGRNHAMKAGPFLITVAEAKEKTAPTPPLRFIRRCIAPYALLKAT